MKMKKELMIEEILKVCEDGSRNTKDLTQNKELCSNILLGDLREQAIKAIKEANYNFYFSYNPEYIKNNYTKNELIKLFEKLVSQVSAIIALNHILEKLLSEQKKDCCEKKSTCMGKWSACLYCKKYDMYTELKKQNINETPDNGLSEMGTEIKYDDFLKKANHLKNLIEDVEAVKVDAFKVNNEKIRSIMTYSENRLHFIKQKDWSKITVEWLKDCDNELFESYDTRLNDDIQILTAYRDNLLKELDIINNDWEKVLKEDSKSWESHREQDYYFKQVLISWNKFNNKALN
jgi:hypothetical protein